MEDTLVFIDAAFVAKLSKYLGKGKYLKFDMIKFAERLSKNNDLFCKHLFYYTAPPFQSDNPNLSEIKLKKGYDKFINVLDKHKNITIRQGRCQRLQGNDGISYHQKGVDSLIVSGMVSVPIRFPKIKSIILVSSDTDFCPIVEDIENLGVNVVLCTYYEKKRGSKFSVSHHLIDSCNKIYYISEKDFKDCVLIKSGDKKG